MSDLDRKRSPSAKKQKKEKQEEKPDSPPPHEADFRPLTLLLRDFDAGVCVGKLGVPFDCQFWAKCVGGGTGYNKARKRYKIHQMRLMPSGLWMAPNGIHQEGAIEQRTWEDLQQFAPQTPGDLLPHPKLWEN